MPAVPPSDPASPPDPNPPDPDRTVAELRALIARFVAGELEATAFEAAYLRAFKAAPGGLPEPAFRALDRLFAAVDAFCADPALRDPGDLDEPALRASAEQALKELG